jgi:hypothetical protein
MIETIKSMATPSRRSKWSVKFYDENNDADATYCYTDERLDELRRNWDPDICETKG